jgi:hypothetical protein
MSTFAFRRVAQQTARNGVWTQRYYSTGKNAYGPSHSSPVFATLAVVGTASAGVLAYNLLSNGVPRTVYADAPPASFTSTALANLAAASPTADLETLQRDWFGWLPFGWGSSKLDTKTSHETTTAPTDRDLSRANVYVSNPATDTATGFANLSPSGV